MKPTSLAEMLRPYRTQAICDATGVSRSNAHNWRAGRTLPHVRYYTALADLLRIDLSEFTRLVVEDTMARAQAGVSSPGQVA